MKQVLVALTLAAATAGPADKFNDTVLKIENETRKVEGHAPLVPKDNFFGQTLYNAHRSVCPAVSELTAKLPNTKAREVLESIAKDYAVQGCKECAQTVRNISFKAELIHPAEYGLTSKCKSVSGAGIGKLNQAHNNDKFSVNGGAEEMNAYLCGHLREKTFKTDEQSAQRFVTELAGDYKKAGCYECGEVVSGLNTKFGKDWALKRTLMDGDKCEKYIAGKIKKVLAKRDSYTPPTPHAFNYHLRLEGGIQEADKNLCKFVADITFLDTRDKAVKKLENLHKSYMSKKFECPQCAEAVNVIMNKSTNFPDIYNYARSGSCKSDVSKIANGVSRPPVDFSVWNGAKSAIKDLCPQVAVSTGGMNQKQEQAFIKKLAADYTKAGCPGCADAVNALPAEAQQSGKGSLAQYAASSKCKSLVTKTIADSLKLDLKAGLEGMTEFCQFVGVKTSDYDDHKAKEWFDNLSMKYRKAGCNDCADVVFKVYQVAKPNIQTYSHSQQCIKQVEVLTKKAAANNKYALDVKNGLVDMPNNLCGFIAEKTAKLTGNQQFSVPLKLQQQYSAAGCEECVRVLDDLSVKSVKYGDLHKFTANADCDAWILGRATKQGGGVIRN